MTTLPQSRPVTADDLDAMPDDGHRYELLDGTLIVIPAPIPLHQRAVLELAVVLREHCPAGLEPFVAPFDVRLAEDTVLQPDGLVCRRADLTDRNLRAAPVLAVEVLSPSTRLIDLNLEKARYEAAGCPAYSVVDPAVPEVIGWELGADGYGEPHRAHDAEEFAATVPFAVSFCTTGLV